jgi:hypothetical protein
MLQERGKAGIPRRPLSVLTRIGLSVMTVMTVVVSSRRVRRQSRTGKHRYTQNGKHPVAKLHDVSSFFPRGFRQRASSMDSRDR